MKDRFNNAVGPQVRSWQKGGSKLIPALAILLLAGGLQAATQFFAHAFMYHLALGPNINLVYLPWGILRWGSK